MWGRLEWLADFPVVAEGINHTYDSPALIFITHWADGKGSGGDSAIECGVWIVGDEDHSRCRATEGFGAEVLVGSGFVGEPEIALTDGELGDNASVGGIDAGEDGGSEGTGVEVDGLCTSADVEQKGEGGFEFLVRRCGCHWDSFLDCQKTALRWRMVGVSGSDRKG